jgi:thiamine biosynthesis lipoprotein
MGCEIVVAGAGTAQHEAIVRLFEARDARFSRFRPGSELNRVNAVAGRPMLVSADFARVVRAAVEAAAWTRGLVDPTVGAAMVALGYSRDHAELVDDPRPVRPAPAGRWRELRLSARLLHAPAGVLLDLNGVVKGLTVDDALALLADPGFVSAGGDLATNHSAVVAVPDGEPVTLRGAGIATSGTGRSWLRGGEVRHHLVDPTTGLSAASPWREVTVAARSCLVADVAAKAAFLLGNDGPAWLDERRLPGRFVGATTVTDSHWSRAVEPEPAACT